jgi:hypothetical protein
MGSDHPIWDRITLYGIESPYMGPDQARWDRIRRDGTGSGGFEDESRAGRSAIHVDHLEALEAGIGHLR